MVVTNKPTQDVPKQNICTVRWNSAFQASQSTFFNFLQNAQLCDVTMKAEGKVIACHKLVMASASLYFQKLFTRQPASCGKDPVVNLNISYINLGLIVKYAYTGEVKMAESRMESFLKAAEPLEMFGLKENFEIINKPRRKKKSKAKNRSKSKALNKPSTKKRSSPEDFRNDVKRIKLNVGNDDWDDWSDEGAAQESTGILNRESISEGSTLEVCSSQEEFSQDESVSRKRRFEEPADWNEDQQDMKKARTNEEQFACKYCSREFNPRFPFDLIYHERRCSDYDYSEHDFENDF